SQFRVVGIDWARYYVDASSIEPILRRGVDDAPRRYSRIWLVMWPSPDVLRKSDPGGFERLLSSNRATLERLLATTGKRYRLNSEGGFGQPKIRVQLYDRY